METDTKVESPKKVKNSNIPVIEAAHVQQSMMDCVIEERMAKKNALKAYVYNMRVKLYDELFEFVTVSDREQFIAKLQKIEDWLYGDGEDESGVYVAKLDELKEQGDPIEQRFKDHVIEETKAKKDAVDAYVQEMMKNLYGKLSEFVTDSDKEKLIGKLQETMDWLHGDGEDEMKGVYVAKLDELKKQGDPIEQRYKEHSERESSVSGLTKRAIWYKKAAFDSTNYSHIDKDDRKKIVQACSNAEQWLKIAQHAQDRQAKHDAPLLLLADIRNMVEGLDGVCKPILFPDVPPKNETDAANMEDAPGTKHGVVDTRDNSVKMETDSKTMSYTEEEIKKMKLSSKKKKNLRRNRRKKNHHSQEDREQEPVSSSSYPPPASLRVEIAQLINESLKRSYPELLGLVGDFVTVKGDAFDMYGDDYQCPNVVDVCDKLREKEPDLFKEKGTEDIAEDFINNLMKSEMIQQVSIRGGCFVSFKLSWKWMAKRIEIMLEKGIDTWAPKYGFKVVVIDFPTPTKNSLVYADFVRSVYIRDSLASMLQYSGVAVPLAVSNWLMYSQPEVDKKISVQQGEYRKRVDGLVAATPLFVWRKEIGAEVGLYNNVDLDLARLWSGSHLQQADFILYITPAQQRRYVEKCFKAARDVGWLKPNTASCCGYWTSSNEKEKLACLAEEFMFSDFVSLMELVKAAGYSSTPEAFFLCAHRYSYLKTHRLFDCTTTLEEMLDVEGNSLVYLLNTMALVHDIMKTPSQEMFKLKNEFLAKERELALHVVRFTDVVKASCTRFLPHLLCDYLYDLCKKFTSCYSKVRPVASRLLLCKATASVMDKCFLLLKITPEPFSERPLKRFFSTEHKDLLNYFIPWPVSNPNRRRNPRIEMISMQIGMVVDGFYGGQMFGRITVSDTCQPQPHGWSVLLARAIGHVAYFEQTWCKPVSISDSCFFFFGNPSTPRLVAFDSSMDICTDLMVTCKSNGVREDACYTICSTKYELKLKEFWEEYRQSKCDTMCFRSDREDAKVKIYYILLKDAVDVKMEFRYESSVSDSRGLRVRGHLTAHYGNVLDDVKDAAKMFYKPVIFKTKDTHVTAGHQLRLQKSVFALPSKGCLTIQAFLVDVNSGVVIVDDTRAYPVIPQGSIQWTMRGEFEGKLILTMNWTTGDGVIN